MNIKKKLRLKRLERGGIKFSIKSGDKVQIIAGDDRGRIGAVKLCLRKRCAVIVEGCAVFKKSTKADEGGGFKFLERPIHVSNVKKVS